MGENVIATNTVYIVMVSRYITSHIQTIFPKISSLWRFWGRRLAAILRLKLVYYIHKTKGQSLLSFGANVKKSRFSGPKWWGRKINWLVTKTVDSTNHANVAGMLFSYLNPVCPSLKEHHKVWYSKTTRKWIHLAALSPLVPISYFQASESRIWFEAIYCFGSSEDS